MAQTTWVTESKPIEYRNVHGLLAPVTWSDAEIASSAARILDDARSRQRTEEASKSPTGNG